MGNWVINQINLNLIQWFFLIPINNTYKSDLTRKTFKQKYRFKTKYFYLSLDIIL